MFKHIFRKHESVVAATEESEVEDRSIIEVLKTDKAIKSEQSPRYFELLNGVGFDVASRIGTGFPRITEEAVHGLLRKRYETSFGKKLSTDSWYYDEKKTRNRCFREYVSENGNEISWEEQPIADYAGLPPLHVLESAKRARDLGLKDLRVVTIDDSNDPLLIARDGKVVLLIDWWDKDFTIDEILNLTADVRQE